MKIVDYIYFRLAAFFYKHDGESAIAALVVLSLVEASLIGAIAIFTGTCFLSLNQISASHVLSGNSGVIIYFLLLIWNYFRYNNKYELLMLRYNTESKSQKRIRGVLVVFALLSPFLLLFCKDKFLI